MFLMFNILLRVSNYSDDNVSFVKCKLSDMNSIFLQLVTLASSAVAMRAIEYMGEYVYGPERLVTGFATLSGSNIDDLPDDFTICSSTTTGGAYTESLSPFQLLHENGEPWITVLFYTDHINVTHHHFLIFVS